MYYRVPLQTKKFGKFYKILYVGNLYIPYFEYIKKVFNWIGELSEEVHVSKIRPFLIMQVLFSCMAA